MGITVGMKGVAETLCEREDTAKEVGSGDLLVYATPCMVGRGVRRRGGRAGGRPDHRRHRAEH